MTAAELKAAREALGLGPVAMARRLGMTYRNYQNLERGARIREQVALLVRAVRRHRAAQCNTRGPGRDGNKGAR